MSELCLHAGGRKVDRAALDNVKVPPATDTWFPIGHGAVFDCVTHTLTQAGFKMAKYELALSRNDARMFGTITLDAPLAPGIHLVIGMRNSMDKSFPLGFCGGSRVFICDNLAFSAEIEVARKHTKFGQDRYVEAVARAVKRLTQFQQNESERIRLLQKTAMTDEKASHVILQAFQKDIISTRQLPGVIKEWQQPSFEEFSDRCAWSLMNAFTTTMADRQKRNAQAFAHATIQLTDLLSKAVDMSSSAEPQLTLPA